MNSIDCGRATITWQIQRPKIDIAVDGPWYTAAEGDTQTTAHTVGKLVHSPAAAGCTELSVDLSRTTHVADARDEIDAFAKALRDRGWYVVVRLPSDGERAVVAESRRAPERRLLRSLRSAGEAIVGAEHITIRALLLASVLINSAQFVIFELKSDRGIQGRSLVIDSPNSLGGSMAGTPVRAFPSAMRNEFNAPFLRFSDISEAVMRKLTAEAIEKDTTVKQAALAALGVYAERSLANDRTEAAPESNSKSPPPSGAP